MTLDQIKNEIAVDMGTDQETWFSILDNTTPGHYGVEDLEFQIDPSHIWVDVPGRKFTFRQGALSFSARLGGSRDGIDMPCKKTVTGCGTFDFTSPMKVEVCGFEINESLDLIE